MRTEVTEKFSLDTLQDRLHSMQFQVSPEEKQLLGVTDEDIASFSEESMQLTPAEIDSAIADIIDTAYDSVPAFKKIVDEDAQRGLGRPGKVVSKLLKHLRGVLPPEKRVAIKDDTFDQAHGLLRDVLFKRLQRPAAPSAVPEPVLDKITPEELSLFQVPGTSVGDIKMTPDARWDDVKAPVLFFLGMLKDSAGKRVKNEATVKMPDDLKIAVLAKFLYAIRSAKVAAKGKLSPVDEGWLGKSVAQMQSIARALVVKAASKPDPQYTNDLIEVNRQAGEMLSRISRIEEMFKDKKFTDAIKSMTDAVDTALPSVSLFEDRIKGIQEEIDKLGLSKSQVSAITAVDPETLSYGDPVAKILDDQRRLLSDVTREITEKGASDDLLAKKKNIESQIKQLEELGGKDTTGLKGAISDYVGTLKAYKDHVKTSLIDKKVDDIGPAINDFVSMVNELALGFNRVAREQLFKARWDGKSGALFNKMELGQGAPSTEGVEQKQASDGAAGYASKLEQFRGKGLGDAFKEIADIIESPDKLLGLRDKIVSLMELSSGSKLNPTGEDFTGNPLGGKGMSISDASDIVNRLRSLVKKIQIMEKGDEAISILRWAATLQNHIKSGKGTKSTKSPATQVKMASAAYHLRRIAQVILGEEEKAHRKYQSPGGTGSDTPYPTTGKAGWLIFRERMTKMGKKTLQSFFNEPDFTKELVEEMEREGLSSKLMHGSEDAPMDIDPILERVLQKTTGKKGDLGNILGSKVVREFKTEFDIKKTQKELDEASQRVKDLNTKISETEAKYLPKLEAYSEFIKDPISATREQLEELKGQQKDKKEKSEKDISYTDVVSPESIGTSNYQSVLKTLSTKYGVGKGSPQDENFVNKYFKQAAGFKKVDPSETSRMVPTEFMKQYMVWKKQLKVAAQVAEVQKDAYKRAVELEKYYSLMVSVLNRLSSYFEYQTKVMDADAQTIANIAEYLVSDEAKQEKPENISTSKILLSKLKNSFGHQKKIFDQLQKAHSNVGALEMTARDQLDTIREDLSDKRADMLYEIAISPELRPNKFFAQELKEKVKEHEKGLSFLIDRNTYKKNMNRLMTLKIKRDPHEWFTSEGKPNVLPPERKQDLERILKEDQEELRKFNQLANFGMKQIALEKMENDLVRAKKTVEEGKTLIQDYTAFIQNYEYLKANKDTIDPEEYKKQDAALSAFLEGRGLDAKSVKKEIKREEEYLVKVEEYITSMVDTIEDYRKEMEKERPPRDLIREIKNITDKLLRLKLVGQDSLTKPKPLPEKIKLIEDKQKQLEELEKITYPVKPGTPEAQAFKKFREELEHEVNLTGEMLQKLRQEATNLAPKQPMGVQAGEDDSFKDLSPYEQALETKGVKPAPYMEQLKKPQGWEIVEHFFDELKREHNFLKKFKEDKKDTAIRKDFLEKRLNQLENMTESVDQYMKQVVTIGGDKVLLRDLLLQFDETLHDYEQDIRRYINQRDDAISRQEYLKQEMDHLKEMYDPATGEFRGLGQEEVENLKGIFLRMLYRDLERYWSTKVGKNLSVFGERDTQWYNNVFTTFKNIAQARSNKKMLGLINKYKQETRSDFDDNMNRLKSQDLEKRLDVIVKRYKEISMDNLKNLEQKRDSFVAQLQAAGKDPEQNASMQELNRKIENLKTFGVDPTKSPTIQDLMTRISTLKKQEGQIRKVFDEMAGTAQIGINAAVAKSMAAEANKAKAEEEKPVNQKPIADLEKKVDQSLDTVADDFEKEIDDLIKGASLLDEVETALSNGETKLGISTMERPPVEETKVEETKPEVEKVAYDRSHPDFNLNILYGEHMQGKIAAMLSEIIE